MHTQDESHKRNKGCVLQILQINEQQHLLAYPSERGFITGVICKTSGNTAHTHRTLSGVLELRIDDGLLASCLAWNALGMQEGSKMPEIGLVEDVWPAGRSISTWLMCALGLNARSSTLHDGNL